MYRRVAVLSLVAFTLGTAPVHADDHHEVSTARRIAAIAAAIVPGFIVHGAGSWVLGDKRTAKRLALAGFAGLGLLAGAGVFVGQSRGNPYTIEPGVPLTIIGAGVYFPTWFTDIWVAAGGTNQPGVPTGSPPWSLELGTTYQHEAYRERGIARGAARLELGRLGLGGSGLFDAEGEAWLGELEARWQIFGSRLRTVEIPDGSRLVVRTALRAQRDDRDDVSLATAELELIGRGDLRRLDPLLAGTFLEVSTGIGAQRVTYARDRHAVDSILLGRFVWGAYLCDRGEATIFYDHRRDSLAGGLAAWRAAGFVGSFGGNVDYRFAGPWAVRAELEIGNAWVTTVALRYHGGQ